MSFDDYKDRSAKEAAAAFKKIAKYVLHWTKDARHRNLDPEQWGDPAADHPDGRDPERRKFMMRMAKRVPEVETELREIAALGDGADRQVRLKEWQDKWHLAPWCARVLLHYRLPRDPRGSDILQAAMHHRSELIAKGEIIMDPPPAPGAPDPWYPEPEDDIPDEDEDWYYEDIRFRPRELVLGPYSRFYYSPTRETPAQFKADVLREVGDAINQHCVQVFAEAEEMGLKRVREKREDEHYDWLIRYQVRGEEITDIMRPAGAKVAVHEWDKVKKAIWATADRLGLKPRPMGRTTHRK